MNKLFLAATGIVLILCNVGAFAQDARQGADDYKLCAGCHGFKGEGNHLVNAPKLTGLQGWYLERQISHFRDGVRGVAEGDDDGHSMALMASALTSDRDVADIVAYIATLPELPARPTLDGDVARGESLYATCAACHGAAAEGSEMTNSPSLAGMDDWYQLAQLQKFRRGQRGSAAADIYGSQMAPMASLLADEQAMLDVIAYIRSLER